MMAQRDKLHLWTLLILFSRVETTRVPSISYFSELNSLFKNITQFVDNIDQINLLGEEDAYLDASQLIQKHNYTAEEYTVTTDDGYILVVQRIPQEKLDSPVVLLQHGIMDSADTWLIGGPESKDCLPFMLADAGYDVWLGNNRGNKYARHHVTLDPAYSEFWKFSYDELAIYDLPATIDFILKTTGQRQLYYIGHSQGTAVFYAMCASLPDYNSKIRLGVSLAPVAWIPNIFSPFLRMIAEPLSVAGAAELLETLGFYELLPNNTAFTDAVQVLCSDGSSSQEACVNVLFQIFGYDYELMNRTRLPVYLSHTPAGGSIRQLAHFSQELYSGKFRRFDHGELENLAVYGSLSPPEYEVANIVAPVALFRGGGDWIIVEKDVATIVDNFPNIVLNYLVPFDNFTHIDLVWGLNASTLVYDKVLELLYQH